VVAIVRGGGSLTDLKPFDEYELAKCVASFPIPILTGIGHDRNTSIVDMMARQEKTPTKVANVLVERNFGFENSVLLLNERLEYQVENLFKKAKNDLKELTRFINASNPTNILKKGFAIVKSGDTILTNGSNIGLKDEIQVIFEKETLQTTVTKKAKNGKEINL
jgi:exodeoxyribonuclease VII large subunit